MNLVDMTGRVQQSQRHPPHRSVRTQIRQTRLCRPLRHSDSPKRRQPLLPRKGPRPTVRHQKLITMTVKELFNSLTFEEVMEALQHTHKNDHSIKSTAAYKGAFDEMCDTEPSDEGGEVTFQVSSPEEMDDSHSLPLLAFEVEGEYWRNIVGKTVVAPENNPFTDAELAGAILWGATFYGFSRHSKWEPYPEKHSQYGEMRERLERKLYEPYIRDKRTLREIKALDYEWVGVSFTLEEWELIHIRQKHQNRMKRKRFYRLKKRIEQLRKLDQRTHTIETIKAGSGVKGHPIYDRIFNAASILEIWRESHRSHGIPRTDYLIDILSNYNPKIEDTLKEAAELAVVVYTSSENPTTPVELSTLTDFFSSRINIPVTVIPATNHEAGPDMWLQLIGICDKSMDDEDDADL